MTENASDIRLLKLEDGFNANVFSEVKLVRLATTQTIFRARYPIPPGTQSFKTEEKPSAWWRRFWPFGPRR